MISSQQYVGSVVRSDQNVPKSGVVLHVPLKENFLPSILRQKGPKIYQENYVMHCPMSVCCPLIVMAVICRSIIDINLNIIHDLKSSSKLNQQCRFKLCFYIMSWYIVECLYN